MTRKSVTQQDGLAGGAREAALDVIALAKAGMALHAASDEGGQDYGRIFRLIAERADEIFFADPEGDTP